MDNSSAAVNTAGSVPLPPLFPNFSPFPITNNLLRGTGQLTWLSPKSLEKVNASSPLFWILYQKQSR
ncbi:hypothetical protein Ddc_11187 [Ditylenchus destructor]|nr:hypothetical protein Ddc_11187 [Ditylenchus destructor]